MGNTTPRFNFFAMFRDGFKKMTLGKTLWTIVIVKLIVMFFVLRPLFFQNFLNTTFETEEEKAEFVTRELIDKSQD